MAIPNSPIVNAGNLYINGLELDYQGGLNALLNMEPGQARDDSNTNDIILPQAVDANGNPVVDQYGNPVGAMLNGAYVGPNGVDVAPFQSAHSAIYGVFVIGDSTAHNPSAGLFSLNEITPVLPEGYDMYRRVGYAYNTYESLNISQWYQFGSSSTRTYYYDIPFSQGLPSPLPTSYTPFLFFSPAFSDQLLLDVAFKPNAATDLVEFLPYGSPAAAANPSTARGCVVFGGGVAAATSESTFLVPTTPVINVENGQPYPTALFKVSSTSDILAINVTGFVDFLT